jgi:hypothetical protein
VAGGLVPAFDGVDSVLLATGILGATVMPHVIYLHSALTQDRIPPEDPAEQQVLLRSQRVDVVVAMGLAGLVNLAMLVLAARLFFGEDLAGVDTLEGAHAALADQAGEAVALAFALALLASGFASSGVGTYAGQIVMAGFLQRQIPLLLRRAITMAPALVVLALGVDPTRALVLSQVVLSFGIPFALVPLVLLTRRGDVMGPLVNRPVTTATAWVVAALVIASTPSCWRVCCSEPGPQRSSGATCDASYARRRHSCHGPAGRIPPPVVHGLKRVRRPCGAGSTPSVVSTGPPLPHAVRGGEQQLEREAVRQVGQRRRSLAGQRARTQQQPAARDVVGQQRAVQRPQVVPGRPGQPAQQRGLERRVEQQVLVPAGAVRVEQPHRQPEHVGSGSGSPTGTPDHAAVLGGRVEQRRAVRRAVTAPARSSPAAGVDGALPAQPAGEAEGCRAEVGAGLQRGSAGAAP